MIGIYGGTFDPIHFGHLRSALEVAEQLSLSRVLMMPSAQPPHRQTPQVTAQHRWQMLSLALSGQECLHADDRELRRQGPSYTYDSLKEVRGESADTPLCLIQGGDVFAGLASWYRWQELLDFCHLVVMRRAGAPVEWDESVQQYYGAAVTTDTSALLVRPAGLIYELDVTSMQISATDIRCRLFANRSVRYLLPDSVLNYIEQNQLYQRALEVQRAHEVQSPLRVEK